MIRRLFLGSCILLLLLGAQEKTPAITTTTFLTHRIVAWKEKPYLLVEVAPSQLHFFLEDAQQEKFRSFAKLERFVQQRGQKLLFAMNGGMYLPAQDNEPQGLYIENGKERTTLNEITNHRPIKTNFYLHPNGVFYIEQTGKARVVSNATFQQERQAAVLPSIKYATQSGPMLVINNQLHPAFTPHSKNVHYRNAVGVLPNGNICLVLSQEKVCFHELATLFKEYLSCTNALYLDGYVSRVYYPILERYNKPQIGDFGVIMAVTKDN